MPKSSCRHCGKPQQEHWGVNFSDGPHISGEVLVCPVSVFQPSEECIQTSEALRARPALSDGGWDAETVKRQVADFNVLCDEIRRLRGELEAAEQHVKILREQQRPALSDEVLREMAEYWFGPTYTERGIMAFARAVLARQQETDR